MRKLENSVIGIEQGDVILFSDYEHDGDMWAGNGPHEIRFAVSFSEKYSAASSVYVSVSMIDMSNAANARADLQSENVTASGFDTVFKTWGDTQVARCRVAWNPSVRSRPTTSGSSRSYTCLRRSGRASCDRTGMIRMCRSTCSGSLGQTSVPLGRCGCSYRPTLLAWLRLYR